MELISHYLREGGFLVSNAINAKDAMSRIQESLPDLIVTDVVMPGMSGFELCRSLKRNAATATIPIVICSSKDQEIDRLWALKQGAAVYVTKPFTRQQLLDVVQSILT
ncbi:MAG: response regulator [Synechococcales cyanobacterium RM1_1_8]|nr:response regulator [Synechococcales cyanobacterium RM1_1_8]